MVKIEKETCEKCLGNYGTFIAQLVHAEEFALRDETDRALARLRWASDAKSRMDGLGCLWKPESKLVDSALKDLEDTIARKEKYLVATKASEVGDHLVRALRYILCEG